MDLRHPMPNREQLETRRSFFLWRRGKQGDPSRPYEYLVYHQWGELQSSQTLSSDEGAAWSPHSCDAPREEADTVSYPLWPAQLLKHTISEQELWLGGYVALGVSSHDSHSSLRVSHHGIIPSLAVSSCYTLPCGAKWRWSCFTYPSFSSG